MYNRYLNGEDLIPLEPDGWQPERPEQKPSSQEKPQGQPQPQPAANLRPRGDLMQEVSSGLAQLLSTLKQHFHLEKLDTGDILLVLIILFLYLEGDNLELVITLGLLLLLGLGDDHKEGS